MKKELIYISFTRFPAEKAHALYMAKVCDAFAAAGCLVMLWVPRRFDVRQVNPYEFYNVKNFKIKRIACLDLLPLPFGKAVWHKLGVGSFALFVWIRMLFKKRDVVYATNDVFMALVASWMSSQVVLEVHDYPKTLSWLYRAAIRRSYRVLTNNHQKADRLQADFNVAAEKIIAVHNGVSLEEFDISISKIDARTEVGLATDKKYALYTGHLYDWKGAEVLAEAAAQLNGVEVVFVGGTTEDIARMRDTYSSSPNIHFVGYEPHERIPLYLKAADVLILPNSGKHELSLYHTSPMKLFEYMASQRPIIASDIPAIREVLSPDNAILVPPDDPSALAAAIMRAVTSDENATQTIVAKAYQDAQRYTWDARAELILTQL